jgi:hypothetical protein
MFGVPALFGRLFYVCLLSVFSFVSALIHTDLSTLSLSSQKTASLQKVPPCTGLPRLTDAVGWSTQQDFTGFMPDPQSVKAKLINLINAVRTVLRSNKHSEDARLTFAVPLIAVNTLVIVYELLLG